MLPQTFNDWLTWVVTGFGLYLWRRSENHERRIQSVEELGNIKIENLAKRFDIVEKELDEVKTKMNEIEKTLIEIKTNIHSHKNQENVLNATLSAILKHLERQEA